MAAYRHQATWRQTTFNEAILDTGQAPDDPARIVENKLNDQITLDTLDIQRVSAQDYRELRQYLEGAEPNESYEGVRAVNGRGIIMAADFGALEDKAWGINEQFGIAACRAAAVNLDPKGLLPFVFKTDSAASPPTRTLRFWCRPGPARPIWVGQRGEGLNRPFSFQLIAFDPFAYNDTETQTALGNLAGGANAVTNPGNIYTYPKIRITFSGLGANPLTLTNTTTGAVVTMNLSATAPDPPAAAEVWIIDTRRSVIYRSSDLANRYGAVLTGFLDELILVPGANNITWSSATGITSVRFDFRGAYS